MEFFVLKEGGCRRRGKDGENPSGRKRPDFGGDVDPCGEALARRGKKGGEGERLKSPERRTRFHLKKKGRQETWRRPTSEKRRFLFASDFEFGKAERLSGPKKKKFRSK